MPRDIRKDKFDSHTTEKGRSIQYGPVSTSLLSEEIIERQQEETMENLTPSNVTYSSFYYEIK